MTLTDGDYSFDVYTEPQLNQQPLLADPFLRDHFDAEKERRREDEKRQRRTALSHLLAAWIDAESTSVSRDGRVEFDAFHQPIQKRLLSVSVLSDSICSEGEHLPVLSTAKLLALSVLLDDDSAAAAALADYMVESGVEAFTAERERTKRRYDAARTQLFYERPLGVEDWNATERLRQRLFDDND